MATIAANLQAVRARIEHAAAAAGRPADEINLLAVSKTVAVSRIYEAYRAGQHAFGENYAQEGVEKITQLASLLPSQHPGHASNGTASIPGRAPDRSAGTASAEEATTPSVEWHFIGPIQSNKTRTIATHFQWVHSLEREKVALRLNEARPSGLPPLDVCIEINLSGESSKSGVVPGEEVLLAAAISRLPRLRLRGLMAIPEPTSDNALQRRRFALLRELKEKLIARGYTLDTLSMGMSDDFEAAIAEGATIVRIGTAIFGPRNP